MADYPALAPRFTYCLPIASIMMALTIKKWTDKWAQEHTYP